VTWSFDPRHSPYDSAATLELWMLHQEEQPTMTMAKQDLHIANVARLKSLRALQRSRCAGCGLELAINCGKTYCVSCAAQRKVQRNKVARINRKFVGHLPQTLPKPS